MFKKQPPKYCKLCGCPLETFWSEISCTWDENTGVGLSIQHEVVACPRIGLQDHYWEKKTVHTGNKREVVIPPKETCN